MIYRMSMTYFCAYLFAAIASTTCITIAILSLIPAEPFSERNLNVGVTLLVLSCLGIIGSVSALIGAGLGFLCGMPIDALTGNE